MHFSTPEAAEIFSAKAARGGGAPCFGGVFSCVVFPAFGSNLVLVDRAAGHKPSGFPHLRCRFRRWCCRARRSPAESTSTAARPSPARPPTPRPIVCWYSRLFRGTHETQGVSVWRAEVPMESMRTDLMQTGVSDCSCVCLASPGPSSGDTREVPGHRREPRRAPGH